MLADVTERPLMVETSLGRDYAPGERVHLKVDRDGLLLVNE